MGFRCSIARTAPAVLPSPAAGIHDFLRLCCLARTFIKLKLVISAALRRKRLVQLPVAPKWTVITCQQYFGCEPLLPSRCQRAPCALPRHDGCTMSCVIIFADCSICCDSTRTNWATQGSAAASDLDERLNINIGLPKKLMADKLLQAYIYVSIVLVASIICKGLKRDGNSKMFLKSSIF